VVADRSRRAEDLSDVNMVNILAFSRSFVRYWIYSGHYSHLRDGGRFDQMREQSIGPANGVFVSEPLWMMMMILLLLLLFCRTARFCKA